MPPIRTDRKFKPTTRARSRNTNTGQVSSIDGLQIVRELLYSQYESSVSFEDMNDACIKAKFIQQLYDHLSGFKGKLPLITFQPKDPFSYFVNIYFCDRDQRDKAVSTDFKIDGQFLQLVGVGPRIPPDSIVLKVECIPPYIDATTAASALKGSITGVKIKQIWALNTGFERLGYPVHFDGTMYALADEVTNPDARKTFVACKGTRLKVPYFGPYYCR